MFGRLEYELKRVGSVSPKRILARDVLRPKILKTNPIFDTIDERAELHVLTSTKDWLNLIWSLKSFYKFSDRKYKLVVHGDPNLPQEAVAALHNHFPDARMVQQSEAHDEVLDNLSGFPRCQKLRRENILSIKVFDFLYYLSTDTMILFDSDLLFFKPPVEFVSHLSGPNDGINRFNRDVSTAYAINKSSIEAAGHPIADEVNSGFGIIHKASMPLAWLEEFLAIPGLIDGHFWRIEQTLYALCATRYGVELLSDDYRVFLSGELEQQPFRHYVGAVRDLMYTEGMRRLAPVLLNS